MHKLKDLKEKLIEELEDYSENGKFSKEDVESIKYMASAVDHLCHIIDEYEEKYSGNYPMYEASYARRDARGRYMSDGYSRAMDDMTMELRNLMKDAPNENVRQEFQRFLTKIEHM